MTCSSHFYRAHVTQRMRVCFFCKSHFHLRPGEVIWSFGTSKMREHLAHASLCCKCRGIMLSLSTWSGTIQSTIFHRVCEFVPKRTLRRKIIVDLSLGYVGFLFVLGCTLVSSIEPFLTKTCIKSLRHLMGFSLGENTFIWNPFNVSQKELISQVLFCQPRRISQENLPQLSKSLIWKANLPTAHFIFIYFYRSYLIGIDHNSYHQVNPIYCSDCS